MGEIIDLIIDFEKGLIQLLKDLIVRPQQVADKIITKEKKYIAPYKFYTLVISLWIIYYQIYLKETDFSISGEDLPLLFLNYENSYENFMLLILPFLVLFEFFLPVALVNALLFRKKKLSLLNHLSLNIYLAGLYMLSSLIIMAIAYPLADWIATLSSSAGAIYEGVIYFFLFGLPAIHFAIVHVKIFERPKAWNFIKPLLSFGAILFVFVEFVDGSSFEALIHKKIYYFSLPKIELKASPDDFYHYDYLENSKDDYFTWTSNTSNTQSGHSFTNGQYGDEVQTIGYYFSNKTDTLNLTLNKVLSQSHYLQISQCSPTQVLVFDYLNSISDSSTNLLWDINPQTKTMVNHEFKGPQLFSFFTRGFKLGDKTYFTGFDEKRRMPFLCMIDFGIDSVFTEDIDFPNLAIGGIKVLSDSSIAVIGGIESNNKLMEIHQVVLTLKNLHSNIESDVMLYKNEFNPTRGQYTFLHIGSNSPHQVFTSYQLATDSSYATHITSYDLINHKINWEKTVKVKADLAIVSEVLFDEQHTYLMGRAASVFRSNFSFDDFSLPFIKVVDNKNGTDLGTFFLKQADNKLEDIGSLDRTASSYLDDTTIYFCVAAEHFYQINKKDLINQLQK